MKNTIPEIVAEIQTEFQRASDSYPPFHSAHEGFSVLAEEVDELWELVRVKHKLRSAEQMQTEAIQIAAMALRFAYDVCVVQQGKK